MPTANAHPHALRSFVILYVLMYAAFDVASPFWPRFFETRGMSPEQIGLLLGQGTIVHLIAGPVAARVADRLQKLLHVLPGGFHRIRHYGLLADAGRRADLARVRALPECEAPEAREAPQAESVESIRPTFACPCCGAAMRIIETFLRCLPIRAPPQS